MPRGTRRTPERPSWGRADDKLPRRAYQTGSTSRRARTTSTATATPTPAALRIGQRLLFDGVDTTDPTKELRRQQQLRHGTGGSVTNASISAEYGRPGPRNVITVGKTVPRIGRANGENDAWNADNKGVIPLWGTRKTNKLDKKVYDYFHPRRAVEQDRAVVLRLYERNQRRQRRRRHRPRDPPDGRARTTRPAARSRTWRQLPAVNLPA